LSQENVELVRRVFDAFGRGDFQEAARDFRSDATWHNTREFPGPPVCVGTPAIMNFWRELRSSFEDGGTTDLEQVVEGEDIVVLGIHSTFLGKTSGVSVDTRWAVACRVRGGTISRVDVYGDWSNALKAVGLEG
jgi:ketosteroid isomerase-like protein